MRKISLLCINLFVSLLLISCSRAENYSTAESAPSYGGGAESYSTSMSEDKASYEVDAGYASNEEAQEKKIIISCNISMESNSFDNVFKQIQDITDENGGYVQNAESYIRGYSSSGKEQKSGLLVLRIPSDIYKDVRSKIEDLGKVISVSESTSDETNAYYDINARLTRKQLEEERLLAMIDDARQLKDLIELESRLTAIRTEIELHQASMRNIDRQVSYSTIIVDLTEKADAELTPVSDDLGSRIKNSFVNSFNGTIAFFENIIVFLASVIVPVGIVGVICATAYFIWRKSRVK